MKQRTIVLVPFPFSDQSGRKVRPALVVSNDRFNQTSQDVVVCGITSNVKNEMYEVSLEHHDVEEGALYDSCVVKVESITKIDKSLVIKPIAKIKPEKFTKVTAKLSDLVKTP